jgi:hypothetical protein
MVGDLHEGDMPGSRVVHVGILSDILDGPHFQELHSVSRDRDRACLPLVRYR